MLNYMSWNLYIGSINIRIQEDFASQSSWFGTAVMWANFVTINKQVPHQMCVCVCVLLVKKKMWKSEW